MLVSAGSPAVSGLTLSTLASMSRMRGAGLISEWLKGSWGAKMILLVRDWISLLGCTIVTLMVKGAISYANESQKPSSDHVAAVYMDMPGVPIRPPMLVRIMMWPVCWARNCGSAALMKLTWEK